MFERTGFIIDKERNRFKSYTSFLGFKFGDWKKLRDFKFAAITERVAANTFRSGKTIGNSSTVKYPIFCIYLCIDEKKKILIKKSQDRNDTENNAKDVAEYLGIELVSYLKD